MRKALFYIYIIFIIIITVTPLQKAGVSGINNVYISEFRLDYILHIIAFLPWVLLCEMSWDINKKYKKALILLSGIAFASMSEWAHYFIPYRGYNINDLIYNIAGVLAGSVAWLFYNNGKIVFFKKTRQ